MTRVFVTVTVSDGIMLIKRKMIHSIIFPMRQIGQKRQQSARIFLLFL